MNLTGIISKCQEENCTTEMSDGTKAKNKPAEFKELVSYR